MNRRIVLGAALAAGSLPLAQGCSTASAQTPASLPQAADERRVLEVLADVDRNQRYLSVPPEDGRLLRVLVESIGARHAVEVGTSTGYSGIWLAIALRATGGRLTTFEIDPGRAALARENFRRAGVD